MGFLGGFFGDGGSGSGGGGLSESDVIVLIEQRDDVIDGTPDNIPAAAIAQLLKLAPDNSGIVRTLVEHIDFAVPRSGTFSVYTDAHFRGTFTYAPYPGTDLDDIFYHLGHNHFAKVTLISANNYQWRTTDIATALGADAIWLGQQPNQAIALAQIDTFDATKTYYTYTATDQQVMVLDSSTYVAGSGESRTYEWHSITGRMSERIASLEGDTPIYSVQLIDEPTIITGDDTETIDSFNVDLTDDFLASDTRARARLIFEVKLEKVTNLRIDTSIQVKHGTTVIKTESVPLQNANTEFTRTFFVDVTDVSNGITVDIVTTNSDDTSQDVEVSEVKLGEVRWINIAGSGTLDDGDVTTAKLADGAVTTAETCG